MDASINGLKIIGIASAVPKNKSVIADETTYFNADELSKISRSTGVVERHVSSKLTTSDLCFSAAQTLFEQTGIDRTSVDVLIFVTQTPDYILPATSCGLQARLGLAQHCAAFDVNLGCSGYVYGLWLASTLLNTSSTRRVLLLVGDTISHLVSPQDRSVALLFGDAGTATLIERDATAMHDWHFSLGTDGAGQPHLMVPVGGCRHPIPEQRPARAMHADGNIRGDLDLYMNGSEIFTFTLQAVPKLVHSVLNLAQWALSDVDAFVFHQANQFMLQHLRKRLGIDEKCFKMALENYGNTSSASIPLTISTSLREDIASYRQIVLVGFGVGYSWAAAAIHLNSDLCLPSLVFVDEES